ncbi:hypothetical protein, partial [Klebsiella pneumoniae]|uniref:hypothetical protein n=1 Tax=Klebsiella pneumoniae TaxID=573 RepID=UPI003B58C902
YLQYEPAKALRDAKILVEKAAPARRGQETQKMKGLELLAMAQFALNDYEGVLATAEAYFKAVQEAGLATDSLWFNQYTARVRDLRAKALQAL